MTFRARIAHALSIKRSEGKTRVLVAPTLRRSIDDPCNSLGEETLIFDPRFFPEDGFPLLVSGVVIHVSLLHYLHQLRNCFVMDE